MRSVCKVFDDEDCDVDGCCCCCRREFVAGKGDCRLAGVDDTGVFKWLDIGG